jgi:predicted acetyltransferase
VHVELERMGADDLPTLMNLWELYVYDLSDLHGLDVRPDGCFGSNRDVGSYWRDPRRQPFFIRVDGQLAGFALVHQRSEHFPDVDATTMAEFFVLRKYRRRGVGERAAGLAFDRFPGRWEVREMANNVAAQKFWRKVIGRYTGGQFEEQTWDGRPLQVFDTREG